MAQAHVDAAKKTLAEDKAKVEKEAKEWADYTKGNPTPTQEECDLAKLGASPRHHKEDGSGPDRRATMTRAMGAGAAAPYATRRATAASSS
jgi:hypothetical protein